MKLVLYWILRRKEKKKYSIIVLKFLVFLLLLKYLFCLYDIGIVEF